MILLLLLLFNPVPEFEKEEKNGEQEKVWWKEEVVG